MVIVFSLASTVQYYVKSTFRKCKKSHSCILRGFIATSPICALLLNFTYFPHESKTVFQNYSKPYTISFIIWQTSPLNWTLLIKNKIPIRSIPISAYPRVNFPLTFILILVLRIKISKRKYIKKLNKCCSLAFIGKIAIGLHKFHSLNCNSMKKYYVKHIVP